MKRYLFLLIVALFIPTQGFGQVAGNISSAWTNVLAVDVNLAFGPSSTATWDPSIGFRLQLNDHFRAGIGDVSFGSADLTSGTRYGIMGGPVVEYTAQFRKDLSYSVIAGIPLQARFAAHISSTFGAAPYVGGALDYHFSPEFALAGVARFQYVATEAYLRSPKMLPSSALLIAFGLGFHFYF